MGFRQHKSTRDHIVIMSECIAYLQETAAASANTDIIASATFLDYVAAFDSIDHVFLDEALQLGGASPKIRAIIRSIYNQATAVVRATDSGANSAMSEPFPINRGVVQGDIVSPLCFIIALQTIFLQCDDHPQHGIVLFPDTPHAVRVRL